ncbi:MAG: DNA-processing protein DprA, partial [Pseudomonadota bacterium]|nr:DNA-processing protein DprA [Pseudomonadota bacterium]
RKTARTLLGEFASAEAALGASVAARSRVIGAAAAQALLTLSPEVKTRLDVAWRWLTEGKDEARDAIVVGDRRYPPLLLESADPPLLLYARGDASLLQSPALAIVGSRSPTVQGLETARGFAAHLGAGGLTIVSGLALGIDGAAHQGALDAGAKTIAVVGTGVDIVYPARHRTLAQRIVRDGLVISEFAIGTPSLKENFPVRNRIIAGLSMGTLVVEAALQSGSLITARLAAESGREVFAIPGSIHSPQSRGCHALLRQGAKLVESAADILDELPPGASTGPALREEATARRHGGDAGADRVEPLLAALGFAPTRLDELVARTGLGAAELQARLLELELAGRVARLPGQAFQRIERA